MPSGGLQMHDDPLTVKIGWDKEANVWVATSDDIDGLAIEGETLDKLHIKVMAALHDLVELNGFKHDGANIPAQLMIQDHLTMDRCA